MNQETMFDFDLKTKTFYDSTEIEYGFVKGNNHIVVIKAGQNGTLYGYENKYLELANYIHSKYEASVVCASNPYNKMDPIANLIPLIEEYLYSEGQYTISYLGFSKGASIGAWFGYKYPQITNMVLVNPPLMINYHKIKSGISQFQGKKVDFIFGEMDPSFQYISFLDLIADDRVQTTVLPGEGHHIKNKNNYIVIADKTVEI